MPSSASEEIVFFVNGRKVRYSRIDWEETHDFEFKCTHATHPWSGLYLQVLV